jgi:pimeloyl-ACP methyl ester carboxylesterase
LNQGDFYYLTLSRQIRQVEALLPAHSPVTLIGSSFGGLTAAWLGERNPQIDRLILLAPAFQFLAHWEPKLGAAQMQQWQSARSLITYHYGAAQPMAIDYGFVTDLTQYDEAQLRRPVPTLILHGENDEVIPVQASQEFAAQRPWVKLVEISSDHSLGNVQSDLWQAIQEFCLLL